MTMTMSKEQIEANGRAHETNPDAYPSADEAADFARRTGIIASRDDAQWPLAQPLAEAVRLAEQPLKLAAYRVAMGSRTREDAEAVCDVHHMAANGSSMPDTQIARYLDLLIDAYAAA